MAQSTMVKKCRPESGGAISCQICTRCVSHIPTMSVLPCFCFPVLPCKLIQPWHSCHLSHWTRLLWQWGPSHRFDQWSWYLWKVARGGVSWRSEDLGGPQKISTQTQKNLERPTWHKGKVQCLLVSVTVGLFKSFSLNIRSIGSSDPWWRVKWDLKVGFFFRPEKVETFDG